MNIQGAEARRAKTGHGQTRISTDRRELRGLRCAGKPIGFFARGDELEFPRGALASWRAMLFK
jgi:hypothetical protein